MDEASKLSPGKTESTAVPSPSTKGGSPEKASEEEVRARLFKVHTVFFLIPVACLPNNKEIRLLISCRF